MKKVHWTWDWGVFVPLCPYCKELAYEKDRCVFCGKEYIWVDKSKDRTVSVGTYTVVQTSNYHIHIYKNKRMVMHIPFDRLLGEEELKEQIAFYEQFVQERSNR